jgi:hypothetical protein
MFWKKKDSDLKTEKKALSIMTALQKQRDSTLKVYIDGVYEAIDKVNMILTHLRQTFITCVPYNINLKVRARSQPHVQNRVRQRCDCIHEGAFFSPRVRMCVRTPSRIHLHSFVR